MFLPIKLFLLFFVAFITIAKAEEPKFKGCDTKELRKIGDLSYYWSGISEHGESLRLDCKGGYGIFGDDGRVASSVLVTCQDGKFVELKNQKAQEIEKCEPACSVAQPLNTGLNIYLNKTENLTQTKLKGKPVGVSSSKLVTKGDVIKIYCLANNTIKDIETSPGKYEATSYEYKCGEATAIVRQCIEKKIPLEIIPPTSGIEGTYQAKYSCDLNQLVIPNAKVAATKPNETMSSKVEVGKEIAVSCENGYSATEGVASPALGAKIITKFNVTCDPNGSGKFLNAKACVKRCDVTALLKASQYLNQSNSVDRSKLDIVKKIPNGNFDIIGSVLAKNEDKGSSSKIASPNLYADIGTIVRVQCGAGYAVRETGSSTYEATCLDGSNFSQAKVCEPEVKACDNSEIKVTGNVQDYQSLISQKTNVGTKVAFKCQGDLQQEGYYFQNGGNDEGVPYCKFEGNQSKWSHKVFKCYNGCISTDGSKKVPTGKTVINKTSLIEPIYSYINCNSKLSWESAGVFGGYYLYPGCSMRDVAIWPHTKMIQDPKYKPPGEPNRIRFESTIATTIASEKYDLGYGFTKNNDSWDRTAALVTNNFAIQSCPEKQITLKEFVIVYENFIQGYLRGDKAVVPLSLLDKGFGGECTTSGQFGGNNNYQDCIAHLTTQFEVSDKQYTKTGERLSNCGEVMTLFGKDDSIVKNPNIDSYCNGYRKMEAYKCSTAWGNRRIAKTTRYTCFDSENPKGKILKNENVNPMT